VGARATVVEEVPVRLDVDGTRHAAWTASPDALEALATGRLLADGFVKRAGDILTLDIEDGRDPRMIVVRATVRDAAPARERHRHIREHGCGVLGLVECLKFIDRRAPDAPPRDVLVPASLLHELFAAETTMRDERGGVHGAGVCHTGGLEHIAFDVSRHSAVDKTLGAALLAGVPLAEAGLVMSARISGEIAAKAAVAGVGWIASRSIATTLAVRLARAGGMRMIGRAASHEPIDYR
jgi:FdhD protein